jgi:hypothetical protein
MMAEYGKGTGLEDAKDLGLPMLVIQGGWATASATSIACEICHVSPWLIISLSA